MSSVDTRPLPVSILRWVKTRDLVTQHKAIYMYLWAHPDQTACGSYLLGIDATAADLSITSVSLVDALAEFDRRSLIDLDVETGEIMFPTWFRWYWPKTAAARGAVQSSMAKILSCDLRKKVEKSFESWGAWRKGKEKEKEKAKGKVLLNEEAQGGGAPHPSQLQAATAARQPNGNHPTRSQAGVVCWNEEDRDDAATIEQTHGLAEVREAVASIKADGKEPLPSRVRKYLSLAAGGVVLPQAWWSSPEGTRQAADLLGISAHPGEQMEPFRCRIRQTLAERERVGQHAPKTNQDEEVLT